LMGREGTKEVKLRFSEALHAYVINPSESPVASTFIQPRFPQTTRILHELTGHCSLYY
jgi:hypothetical protein